MVKVSVVVPAYNSHDTLGRCLDSLVNQTIQEIEIIVINDASTDDTWSIMEDYRCRYPDKIKTIDGIINRGSGGARNLGFDIAQGEYIGLVDSDDYVNPNMYEHLYNKAKEDDADIVDCAYYSELTQKAIVFTSDELTGELNGEKRRKLIASGGYLVTKIFRNSLWNEPKVRMREKVRCLEDAEILIYMFLKAQSISNVIEILYYYCDMGGSATKTTELRSYYDSVYGAMKSIYDLCSPLDTYSEAKEAIEYAITNIYSCGIIRCIYDQIERYGASESNIKKYFNGVRIDEKKMLTNLASLKKSIVEMPYLSNKEVVNRMSCLDIHIMEECDIRYG